jgi:hypothetical protein
MHPLQRAIAIACLITTACRLHFDPLAAEPDAGTRPDAHGSTTCAPGLTCIVGAPGEAVETTCPEGSTCIVDCEQAASCQVACGAAALCSISCSAVDCIVTECSPFACNVSCATGTATREGTTVHCEP